MGPGWVGGWVCNREAGVCVPGLRERVAQVALQLQEAALVLHCTAGTLLHYAAGQAVAHAA